MIVIVDYGMGNAGSIGNMLLRLGMESRISSDPADVLAATRIILPGIGSFDRAMENLERLELIPALDKRVLEDEVPFLGICLGMQLLTQGSDEGQRPGLGWIEGRTLRFGFDGNTDLRVPHMGWNRIDVHRSSPILDDRYEQSRYYFVHSFHVQCRHDANVLATTRYGVEFHSAVIRGNVMGTQFHPEKSHKFGLRLLANFSRHEARITA